MNEFDGRPLRIQVIVASTRPGRVGLPIGEWVRDRLDAEGFDVDFADLAEIDLPFFNEPNHPRLGQYLHQHTKDWSARVDAADAFILIMPEYNHSFTAPLKNAIDYLSREWKRKPVGFVSYGGVAGGTRAVQALKPVLVALQMIPAASAVVIPSVETHFDDSRGFQPTRSHESALARMFDEFREIAAAIRPARVAAVN